MLPLTVVLLLAAVVNQSLGQEDPEIIFEEEEIIGSGVTPDLQKEIVDKHNEIRRKVQPPASNMLKMEWNETIGERARKWAEQCRLLTSPKEERTTPDYTCGEIIFQANYVNSWSEVIEYWNERKANFKYGTGAIDRKKGIYSYTQLVWYNTYQVGCGATYCPDATFPFFYVCQYCPAGNFQQQIATPYKQGKPCGSCPQHCDNKLCTNPCKYTDHSTECLKMKSLFTCRNALVRKNCRATCYCKTEIV